MLAAGPAPANSPDTFLSLKDLAAYSGLGVRTLRYRLTDPVRPLPCHRVGRRVLVKRSDYDAWVAACRQVGRQDVAAIVDSVLASLPRGAPDGKVGQQAAESTPDEYATVIARWRERGARTSGSPGRNGDA